MMRKIYLLVKKCTSLSLQKLHKNYLGLGPEKRILEIVCPIKGK